MPYSSGILTKRAKILERRESGEGAFGRGSNGAKWVEIVEVSANLSWNRGTKAMRLGMLDAYDVVMIRMRYNGLIRRDHRIEIDGTTYQIDSFHASRKEDTIQITATELTAV